MQKKVYRVFDIETKKFVFKGDRKQIAVFIKHPSLLTGDRIQERRIYEGRYLMELEGDPYAELLSLKKRKKKEKPKQKEALPSWANGSKTFYQKVMDAYFVLKSSGNCALANEDIGQEFIQPLKEMGMDAEVRATKGKYVDWKGRAQYFDILERC